ncbi:MAG: GH92 family glycosyl hydrolase [Flavobacteriales bacterium]|nr:GH92 family glycosyl hydrolase [Flavobacteriales bacterium]
MEIRAMEQEVNRPGPFVPHTISAVVAILLATVGAGQQASNPARDLVNPFVGTGGHGHTFPGACVPNGLVQLSPDTRPDGYMDWDGCGGYHYSDSVIHGFSHTHLSGTGVADLCDVLLMPMSGEGSLDPTVYRSSFQHKNEEAHAGYYRVWLDDEKTLAELTATAHCGVHRYTMPADKEQFLVIDLAHRDKLIGSQMRRAGLEIVGTRRSSSWAGDQQLFFCLRIGRANGPIGVGLDVNADSTRGIINVKREDTSAIIVKVGISAVSIEGARKNLDAEVPHWDFDRVRAEAEDAWNAKLNKIQVEGGTREQQRIFYTALYHSYVAPYIFNDVDGQYRGMDGEVHKADHNVYTVFSLWDTFRGLHPLMTILEPDMTSDWIKTFLLHYQQGGRLPVWELWGNETDCMIGYHSASVIADAHLKGIRGFDERLALKAMKDGARLDHFGLKAYQGRGFISSDDGAESVSRTLEYAYDDACIAEFGSRLEQIGNDEQGLNFGIRSQSWKHLFDPATGFFRARRNGGFVPGFDPYEVNFNFTEANAWQYSLFVPQDIDGLIAAHGGADKFEAHLDKLFTANTSTSGREQADITGLIGQYAHGNEPSHHMAYLYNRVGKPEKTRALVKRIMHEMYHDAPDGLSGNEDCGQMSAWYVLSALGFYPVSPGIDDRYELGYPLFDRATMHLGDDKDWSMVVGDEHAWQMTVPSDTTLFTRELPNTLYHWDLVRGGGYHFEGDRKPRANFLPRGFTVLDGAYVNERARPIAPVIQAASASFAEELSVTVLGEGTCTVQEGGAVRSCPMNQPFVITNTCAVEVAWHAQYAPVVAHFTKIDGSRSIKLESTFANQYSAGGATALIDGLRGGTDFRTGEWQGYEGQDLVAMIDLGAVKHLRRAGLSVLQDQKSWIFLPKEVVISWSTNKRQWSSRTISRQSDPTAEGGFTYELWTEMLGKKARYINITAKNAGPCPDWHVGKGGKTWIFVDEVLIEAE